MPDTVKGGFMGEGDVGWAVNYGHAWARQHIRNMNPSPSRT